MTFSHAEKNGVVVVYVQAVCGSVFVLNWIRQDMKKIQLYNTKERPEKKKYGSGSFCFMKGRIRIRIMEVTMFDRISGFSPGQRIILRNFLNVKKDICKQICLNN